MEKFWQDGLPARHRPKLSKADSSKSGNLCVALYAELPALGNETTRIHQGAKYPVVIWTGHRGLFSCGGSGAQWGRHKGP